MTDKLSKEERILERRIKTRQRALEKIVPFATNLLNRTGTVLLRTTYPSHVRSVLKIDDCEGFDFKGDFGMTELGGNQINIWYRSPVQGRLRALEVYWQHEHEYMVNHFEEGSMWVPMLGVMIRRRRSMLKRLEERARRAAGPVVAVVTPERNRASLKEQAQRLAIA